jgi:hypothetical protein
MRSAANFPNATPWSSASPSGMCASVPVRAVSSRGAAPGKWWRSTWWAAEAAAAADEAVRGARSSHSYGVKRPSMPTTAL